MKSAARAERESPVAWAKEAEEGEASLDELKAAARTCRACDLWRDATQTVFGEGESAARIMFVGEQPGDREDREGRPFVGPAGALLDRCLAAAGIDRREVYVTNAVKHFRWEARGKWRIHKKPRPDQVRACRPWWIAAEIAALEPRVVVCLGATAAQALLGRDFRVTQRRGEAIESPLAPCVVATVHPASLLRAPDETRRAEIDRFVEDLRTVAKLARDRRKGGRRRG